MKDDRTMESAFMRHLYEVQFPYESTIESVDATRCYQLMSYRQPVSVDHFKLVVQKQSMYFIFAIPLQGKILYFVRSFLKLKVKMYLYYLIL